MAYMSFFVHIQGRAEDVGAARQFSVHERELSLNQPSIGLLATLPTIRAVQGVIDSPSFTLFSHPRIFDFILLPSYCL
jgi:hypothetical protein